MIISKQLSHCEQNSRGTNNEIYLHCTLHKDQRSGTNLRDKIFGHANSVLSFREGLFAKLLGEGELKFYSLYRKQLKNYLPQDLIPEILGVSYILDNDNDSVSLEYTSSLKSIDKFRKPMLLQKDIIAFYNKPAILDLKIGIRTWTFNDSKDVAERRFKKMNGGICSKTNFRVRAAMWYSQNPQKNPKYQKEGQLSVVTRKFGNKCSMDELIDFFRDFMKYKILISSFVKKLNTLKESLIILRNQFGMRLYSSSILIVYDDSNPERFDLRVLDFEKSYHNVEKVAEKYHESLEDCEDGIIDAVSHLIEILESL